MISISDILFSMGGWKIKLIKLADHLIGGLIALFIIPRVPNPIKTELRSVLVIRPGGIGDAVFLIPVLRELSARGIVIDVLCEKRNVEVFTSQGLCRSIWCYDRGWEYFKIFKETYDAVIDTEQWHFFSAITSFFVKAPLHAGFNSRPSRGKFFNSKVIYNCNEYELSSFIRLFECAGVSPHLSLSGSFKANPHHPLLTSTSQKKTAVISMGGSIPQRRFSIEQVENIAEVLFKNNFNVILVGGTDSCSVIPGSLVNTVNVVDTRGKLALTTTAALISQADLFIGHDSGVSHIAAAMGVRSIICFGPGNVHKWGIHAQHVDLVVFNGPCSPCTRFGYTRPTNPRCLCAKETYAGLMERLSILIKG